MKLQNKQSTLFVTIWSNKFSLWISFICFPVCWGFLFVVAGLVWFDFVFSEAFRMRREHPVVMCKAFVWCASENMYHILWEQNLLPCGKFFSGRFYNLCRRDSTTPGEIWVKLFVGVRVVWTVKPNRLSPKKAPFSRWELRWQKFAFHAVCNTFNAWAE